MATSLSSSSSSIRSTIGNSILEYSDRFNQPILRSSNTANKCVQISGGISNEEFSTCRQQPFNTISASLLSTAASALQQERERYSENKSLNFCDNSQFMDTTSSANHMLIQGPRNSGRSSIVMDFAISIASSGRVPCRRECYLSSKPCNCTAVTIFVNENNKEALFPIPCQKQKDKNRSSSSTGYVDENDNNMNRHDVQSNFQQKKDDQVNSSTNKSSSSKNAWNVNALRRIKICHITSVKDCLYQLLSIQGTPKHEQPWGAIIIDDVDILAREHHISSSSPQRANPIHKVNYFRVNQILAILFDTSNTLSNINGGEVCRPLVLATIEDIVPPKVGFFLQNTFFSNVISVKRIPTFHNINNIDCNGSNTTNGNIINDDHNIRYGCIWESLIDGHESVVSHWAFVQAEGNISSMNNHSNNRNMNSNTTMSSRVEYAVVRGPRGLRIIWKVFSDEPIA